MRSVLAVLSLMTNSHLVGSMTDASAGAAPLRIRSSSSHQARPPRVWRRLLRQRNDLLLPSAQESIGTDDKHTNAVQRHVGKRRLDLLLGSGIENNKLSPLDARRGREAFHIGFENPRRA